MPAKSDTLTIENIEQFVADVLKLLKGRKYTKAIVNTNFFRPDYPRDIDMTVPGTNQPEVRTGLRLANCESRVWYSRDVDAAGFSFADNWGVWGTFTNAHDGDLNPNFEHPFFIISHNELRLYFRAEPGHIIAWVLQVEDE